MRDGGQPTRITHAWIKGKGIEHWKISVTTGTGDGFNFKAIPEQVQKWEGGYRKTTISGFQHEMVEFDTPLNASEVLLEVQSKSGETAQVHDLLLLKQGYYLSANSRFVDIEWKYVDRTGIDQTNQRGQFERGAPIGAERSKWQIDYRKEKYTENANIFHHYSILCLMRVYWRWTHGFVFSQCFLSFSDGIGLFLPSL